MELVAGGLIAFLIAALTAPVGVSGAVFLVPLQIGLFSVSGPSVTSTNLLYNVIATPGALSAYWRRGIRNHRLVFALIAGTLPGVIAGSIVRVEFLSSAEAFYLVIALVLGPLGLWLLSGRTRTPSNAQQRRTRIGAPIGFLSGVVGFVGGIYGIGGGSILGPILVGLGFSVVEVAPAALAATFITSAVGLLTFLVLGAFGAGSVVPDWTLGVALGIGGLAGAFVGASLQSRVPELTLRRILGLIALVLAIHYLLSALG